MEIPDAPTIEGTEGPRIKQFSVFLENRVGALLDLIKLLSEQAIEVIAISVQDSTDCAFARLIVSDPDAVEEVLLEEEISHASCEVMVAEFQEAADLPKLLTCLLMAEINMHFSYPLMIRPRGKAALVMHVEDMDIASSVLETHGFRLLSQADISR